MKIRKGDGATKADTSAGKPNNDVGMAFDPIEAALREMHDRVADEAIPDEFFSLLDELDARASNLRKPQ